MEIKAILNKPYTDKQRANFIVENNHNKGYEIQETEDSLIAVYNEPTVEELQAQVRAVRNGYLEKYVDPKQLVLVWEGLSIDERNTYAEYRKYLLDYTNSDDWWLANPMTFDEWLLIGTDEVTVSKMEIVDEDLTENIIDDSVIMEGVDEISG